jgi:hypothetical protein
MRTLIFVFELDIQQITYDFGFSRESFEKFIKFIKLIFVIFVIFVIVVIVVPVMFWLW